MLPPHLGGEIVEHPLSIEARNSSDDPDVTDVPGWCKRAVRQVQAKVYGSQFAEYFEGDDAKQCSENFAGSEYEVPEGHGTAVGDIFFYDDHGPHGHVGIRIPGNRLWENSIVHGSGNQGGKGTRWLKRVGTPTRVVRLPWKDRKRG
jgi:hypothetical protein